LCYAVGIGTAESPDPAVLESGAAAMKFAVTVLILGLCIPAFVTSQPVRQAGHPNAAAGAASPVAPAHQGPPAKKKVDQEPAPKGQTQISVSVDLVNLQALVTDKKGNILTGLREGNFTIYEDNVKQEITHFAPVEASVTVVMLVDFSKMVEWFIEDIWNAIYGFAESLRKGDWVAVIGYDMRPTILTDFTQNRNELMEALSRFNTPAFSESNLSDALIYTLDRVEEIEGKTAVLLVSTGRDTFSQHTYEDALKKCKAANASIYAIGVGQSLRLRYNLDNIDWLMADNRLRSFAELTGGDTYFPRFPGEFPSIFKNISNMLRNQYSLAYASSNTKRDGKFRKIRVVVTADVNGDGKPDELKVQTRSGYLAREK
jgi:Ca-activated chloride channel homolog